MFAISHSACRNLARRALSTTTKVVANNPLIPKTYALTFNQRWLSDPAVYPLIAIMGLAMAIATGMTANAAFRYKGIKIRSEQKHSPIVDWPEARKPYQSITEYITRRPIGFYADGFKSLRYEGLGVDHEKWKKSKEEEKKI